MKMNSIRNGIQPPAVQLVLAALLLTPLTTLHAAAAPQPAGKPNLVILLADDLGWRDLSCYGSPFCETPNIDGLATQGIRFTQAYSSGSVCSPTRSSLQTGKYPPRTGITDWIPGLKASNKKLEVLHPVGQLAPAEYSLAKALKAGGYQTFYAGKWHLGDQAGAPQNHGYETVQADNNSGEEPGGGKKPGIEGGRQIAQAAIRFMKERDTDKPFFAFLSFHEPHTPIEEYPDHIAHFTAKAARLGEPVPPAAEHDGLTRTRQDHAAYGSEVAGLDDWVGLVLKALEEQKLADSTIVMFLSDNGGLATKKTAGPTCNAPLRAGKGWLYEGGIRIPLIVRAPGLVKPGGTSGAAVITTDFYPTLLELAGLPPQPQQHLDGMSFAAALRGEPLADRPLFWHYPHYHASTWRPGAAVRDGDWKLIEFYDYGTVELYNLKDDLGEARNVASSNSGKVRELLDKLHAWQQDVGARIPAARTLSGTDEGTGKKKGKRK